MIRFPTTAFVIGLLAGAGVARLAADEATAAKAPDTFFAGTVAQVTPETITVGRTVRGKRRAGRSN